MNTVKSKIQTIECRNDRKTVSSSFYWEIKEKLSLCLTKHNVIKVYWGSGGIAPRI